jgi:hypothetical protein
MNTDLHMEIYVFARFLNTCIATLLAWMILYCIVLVPQLYNLNLSCITGKTGAHIPSVQSKINLFHLPVYHCTFEQQI